MTYENCCLCPRKCGVNRVIGQRGYCAMGAQPVVARSAPHFWEEPVISGSFGSGTVFFSGCTLGCGFCQNTEISQGHGGKTLDSNALRVVFERLIDEGVENINLVTATHFLPSILPALMPKLPVPVVYNCGGYESLDTLRALEGKIDVYLPDFKYSNKGLAKHLSAAEDYPEIAAAAILEMRRQTGPCVVDSGQLRSGVLVRHLILPGQVDNSLGVVDWIGAHFSMGDVLFSLMAQYTPMGKLAHTPPYDRCITEDEYAAVRSWMKICRVEHGFFQDFSAASCHYIPDFSGEGL